jgi:D-glycero-alpha-D-manno-heptose 1-phosphate guanylyltransferase
LDALILAGGLGTRLSSVVSDRAKSVATVMGRPFLSFVLDHLAQSGSVSRVVLCVGHRADTVRAAFGDRHADLPIVYSEEPQPLGTGGALRRAILEVEPGKPVLAMNGDTILNLRVQTLIEHHKRHRADLTLALAYVKDAERFGTVALDEDRITGFREKGVAQRGWINGGMYVLGAKMLDKLRAMPEKFSLERDFFMEELDALRCFGYRSRAAFLDIGVPEDYRRAASLLRR